MLTLLALLLVVQATSARVTGPPPPPPISEGTSAITGHVIDGATGALIAGARGPLTAMTCRNQRNLQVSGLPDEWGDLKDARWKT